MTNFASKISGAAMLMLAALPMAALATGAHAQAVVKVADINVLTPQGMSTFNERANAAANRYCANELSLSARNACRVGVKAELNEKLAGVRTAQADRASKNLAAR